MPIRPATQTDLSVINEIYNYYVLNSTATYQTEPSTEDERLAWFKGHDAAHPIIVAVDESQQIVGWGSLSPFHARAAYRYTVEDSVYIHHDYHRRGIGRALLAELIAQARVLKHHSILGVISADQIPSVALHSALGFVHVGTTREVGHKFGRWLDVAYMQLLLKS